MTVTALTLAEAHRAARRAQTARVLAFSGVGLGVFAALERWGDGAATDDLAGLRAAAPLVAVVLGVLYTGRWWSTGTAAIVATWVRRRWHLPVAEVAATTAVTTALAAVVWTAAVLVLAGPARAPGTWPDGLAAVAVGVPLAAALGASVGILCRSAAGGLLVVVGTYLFVEPLVRAGLGPRLGGTAAWLMPVSALLATSGAAPADPVGSPAPPWVVAAAWCLAAGAAALGACIHRDLR